MHSFEFEQQGERALGCKVLLDGKPFQCESFSLVVEVGQIPYLEAKIPLSRLDVTVNEQRLVIQDGIRTVDDMNQAGKTVKIIYE